MEQVTRPVPGGALLAGALTAVFGSSGGQTEVRTQSGEHWLVSLPPLGEKNNKYSHGNERQNGSFYFCQDDFFKVIRD